MQTATKPKNKRAARTISRLHRKDNIALWLMVLPGLIYTIMFSYVPMFGLRIAFTDYHPLKGIWGSPWVGLENFKMFFGTVDAVRTITNTITYSLIFIIVDVIFALALAILLFNLTSGGARKAYQTIIILPRFMSFVLIAYIVEGLLNNSGVINSALMSLGILDEPILFYTDSKYWPVILTITHIWKSMGMNSVMYLAALSSMDTGLVEAATIDGANRWQVTRNVYIPHLMPIVTVCLILSVGTIFNGDFGLFYSVPKDTGALYPTTDIVATYVYRGLTNGNMDISAAIGLVQSACGCIAVVLTNLAVRKINPESALF